MDLVVARPEGLYCPPGDFYIDPWRPVARAVVTHAHSDHARSGHGHYLAHAASEGVMRHRLGEITLQPLAYGEAVVHNGVRISLHPAGHVLGSSQVRIEWQGEVWVASGDYKLDEDPTCVPFEPVRCHTFITESTFGLPIYRWPTPAALMAEVQQWWAANAAAGRPSVIGAYAFGKAQRLLAGLDPATGPLLVHGAVDAINHAYRAAGVALPPTLPAAEKLPAAELKRALVVAPPSALESPWMKRFPNASDAFASGWMLVRGARRRRGVDRGFVLSDHADWPSLQRAIKATGAQRVIVTHGQVPVMVRWLTEQGLQAEAFRTEYEGEGGETAAESTVVTGEPAADAAVAPEALDGTAP